MSAASSTSDNPFFSEFLDDFFAECDEHLTIVRRDLLALEARLHQPRIEHPLLDELLRSFHTLKGLAGMVGVHAIEQLAHQTESYLRALRQGQVSLTPEALTTLVAATQQIEQTIVAFREQQPITENTAILGQLAALLVPPAHAPPAILHANGNNLGTLKEEERHRLSAAQEQQLPIWRFIFTPSSELTERGINVNVARERLQSIGEVIRATPQVLGPGRIAFEFLVAGIIEEATRATWEKDGLAGTAVELLPEFPAAPIVPPAPAAPVRSSAPSHLIRVDLERIDNVIHTVGELVISRARLREQLQPLEEVAPVPAWRALQETMLGLERQLRDLRQGIMQMRMVPIGEVFARMQFVVHDLARASNKQIALELSGQDTEIDKFVVERMLDPLLHLVRNAVSHGLEAPDERVRLGKPPAGQIALRASTAGDVVLIEIEDDGRGVDTMRVAARAQSLGMIDASETLDPAMLLQVICSPGFSTREQADRVSGRGVGMEIVKQTVQELGGVLSLETEPGQGAHFSIQLPLTLAIIDALIVVAGQETFAIPLSVVREVIEIEPERITTLEHHALLSYRSSALPLIRLAQRFGLATETGVSRYALVTGSGISTTAIGVERIVGMRETVVRVISDPLIQVPGVSGATELGDGRPILILDAQALSRTARTIGALPRPGTPAHGKREAIMTAQITSESYVLFELANSTYGLPSRLVRQIELVEQITPVPNAPPFVAGVVFSRGMVLPALDLRVRFGFEKLPYTLRTRLIVVQANDRTVGLIVDTAREFVNIAAATIQPPPEAITGVNGAYVNGIARLGERLIVLLDLEEVLLGTDAHTPAHDNG